MSAMKPLGLYLHVPFCKSRCHYCDFCSSAGRGHADMERYVGVLCDQIAGSAPKGLGYVVDTVYLGGGTPTLLPVSLGEKVLTTIGNSFALSSDAEITMECNPATVSREDLLAWRRLGVNRLSIGAQSMVPQELSALGRAHGCEDVIATVRAAREAGFDNVSLDVMYGIPHQTAESFAYTLDALIALSPEHMSAYCLKIEEGTRFYACRDTLPLPDEDTVCDMYSEAARRLAEYGLVQYEISNFSKPGRESRHNLKYWRGEAYLGFGAAAHSYFEKERFWAPEDIDLYEQGVFRAGHEPIDEEQTFAEYIMLRLRLREGIAYEAFGTRFGKDFRALFSERLRPFAERGLVVMDEERCYLTVEGMFLSNAILVELLDF